MEKPEILVHISAPSAATDDARYRSQVDAILGFQSVSRQNMSIAASGGDSDSVSSLGDAVSSAPTRQSSAEPRKDPNLLDKAGDIGTLHLSTLTAGDANENGSRAPVSGHLTVPPAPAVAFSIGTLPKKRPENDSLGTPISVIPDSQPQTAPPEPDALQYLETLPRGPTKRRRLDSPTSKKDPSPPIIPRPSEPTAEHPASKDTSIPRAPQPAQPSPTPPRSQIPTHQPPNIQLATLPLEIHPPPPATSTNPFTTHLTPTLTLLSKRLSLSRIYKPTHQTRALDTFERGHWFFHINVHPKLNHPAPNDWDTPTFNRFWTFLSDFISNEGRAGWGVWCIVEAAQTEAPNPGLFQPLTLKVYTWGEIASHVYLLLFLASERRIRKMGAQWRDGAEEVVVQM